ncbi:MAG: transaldolase [Hyphomicrobiales bacterium]|nr:transaldolase [Hyphomicrobiales bacterium]
MDIDDLRDVPAFFDIVAERIWSQWHAPRGVALAELRARLEENMRGDAVPKAFVAHAAGRFLGTISLIANDLAERPQYAPWAAALWVEPEARGCGIGNALLDSCVAAALNNGEKSVYLCAREDIRAYYLGRGWRLIEAGVGERHLSVLRRDDLQEHRMPSKLDQLKSMTTIVADTGDIEAIKAFKPTDCTTNPSLILKAAGMPQYRHLVDEAIVWGRSHRGVSSQITDRLAINFGTELTKIVPGRVSTEVDADLSFDAKAMIDKARALIAAYAERGVDRERILIKLASTWEGVEAARVLQKEGIDCNMTLLFSLAQAAVAADAGAFLISPFVGRILDWHKAAEGKDFTSETDPGVLSVRTIYAYYKAHGVKTVVMGASFRNAGEIEALAGCDRLTISPQLLEELSKDEGKLERRLSPDRTAGAPAKMNLDEKTFRWLLNEDRMATEKLSDGIRLFAKDLRTLRELVSKRLEEAA